MIKDIINQKFGKLTAIEHRGFTKYGNALWQCGCECGNKVISSSGHLTSGHTQSCGCLMIDRIKEASTTHGMTHTAIYRLWCTMHDRCYNKNCKKYKDYGARGIVVCERWHDVKNFVEDMGERPQGKTLNRINNDGNYEPTNCEWATPLEQANNKRNNRWITYNGETLTVAQWGRKAGINPAAIIKRLFRGWSIKKALTLKTT